jgi:hypothetical protein
MTAMQKMNIARSKLRRTARKNTPAANTDMHVVPCLSDDSDFERVLLNLLLFSFLLATADQLLDALLPDNEAGCSVHPPRHIVHPLHESQNVVHDEVGAVLPATQETNAKRSNVWILGYFLS